MMKKKVLLCFFILTATLHVRSQTYTFRPGSDPTFSTDSVIQFMDLQNPAAWTTSTTPCHQPGLFPEGSFTQNFTNRINCAKLSWYSIDPLFYDLTPPCPPNILNDPGARSGFFVNQVFQHELFPELGEPSCCPVSIPVLNLAYYPDEKGLFNFDTGPGKYSAGIEPDGHLKNPGSRWGGIMRMLPGTGTSTEKDTLARLNYRYINFWLMDPFVDNHENDGGQMFIDIGNVSEDLLNPGIADVEAGDKGYDNMDDHAEQLAFQSYIDTIASLLGLTSTAYTEASSDPSNDKYHHFRGSDYDQRSLGILDRYKYFSCPDGNSTNNPAEQYPTIATTRAETEDINRNGLIDSSETYYQYKLDISPVSLQAGKNQITKVRKVTTTFPDGVTASVNWYHFQVPVDEPDTITGDFNHVGYSKFMRIFLKGFNMETHLRFATLQMAYLQASGYNDRIRVYPNPTEGPLTIDFDNRTPRKLMLFDLMGRLIREQSNMPDTRKLVKLDLSALSMGGYFLKLVTDQETTITKIAIVK